ncbi:ArdC-like ssDNA-binding domain-containing protein [Arthrobacter sp. efr-133-TYG-120]|uniref:ArdC-like ssDNA-binding domain-containing protein n=1 Tax=Arthrobacter sp. efr-133-TYG-120 TaxID=3040280 RepID=UPI002551579D|nr:ArdC-like ssDNA-binding domain-containing protein [Arthrobacter sp. efr-133-TYG-120]
MAPTSEFEGDSFPLRSAPRLDGLSKTGTTPEERITVLTQELHAMLEEAVESPAQWQVLLDASASLWRYSGGNVALLMMQMAQRGAGEPTLVAGYKEWERHGRTVLKGEHALWVIAPRTARMHEFTMPDGTRLRLPIGEDGPMNALSDEKKSVVTGWRGQAVFDVSQTRGRPLLVPRGDTPSAVSSQKLWDSLALVASRHGFELQESNTQHGLSSGYTDFARHRIEVGNWMNAEDRAAVLAHELGHVMLHGPGDKTGNLYGSSTEHRGLAEIEAESVAYTVLKAHGIDRGEQSALYLWGWAESVIQTQRAAFDQDMYSMRPTSRADVATSVLGRVTAAAKGILEITHPPGLGGKLTAVGADPNVRPTAGYADSLLSAGSAGRTDGPEMAGP